MDNSGRPDASLWHQIKPYIIGTNAEGAVVPIVSCPICFCEINIFGVPPAEPDPSQRVDGCYILTCGHMFCRQCWDHLRDVRRTNNIPQTGQLYDETAAETQIELLCPICKQDQRFSACLHHMQPAWFPSRCVGLHGSEDECNCIEEFSQSVPLTLPEISGWEELPVLCYGCRFDEEEAGDYLAGFEEGRPPSWTQVDPPPSPDYEWESYDGEAEGEDSDGDQTGSGQDESDDEDADGELDSGGYRDGYDVEYDSEEEYEDEDDDEELDEQEDSMGQDDEENDSTSEDEDEDGEESVRVWGDDEENETQNEGNQRGGQYVGWREDDVPPAGLSGIYWYHQGDYVQGSFPDREERESNIPPAGGFGTRYWERRDRYIDIEEGGDPMDID